MHRIRTAVPMLLAAFALASCTKVPREVVELSLAVEDRITVTQASHEAFVAETFATSRARIEDFLQYRWIPVFLEDYVRRSDIVAMISSPEPFDSTNAARLSEELQKLNLAAADRDAVTRAVKNAFGDTERGLTMLDFADAAIEQINLQRRELMTPLASLERKSLEELRANYAELMSMQKTITQFLQSIREVKELEERTLSRLGLMDERDKILRGAVDLNDEIVSAIETAENASTAMEKVKGTLGIGGN